MELEHIKEISSWDSGGGLSIDIVELKNGRVIGITDESIVLYQSKEELLEGTLAAARPTINLV